MGRSQVLFDVGLTLAQGEDGTLLGRNGMGKTTTIRSILGLKRILRRHDPLSRRAHRSPGSRRDRAHGYRGGAGGAPDIPEPVGARESRGLRGQPQSVGDAVDSRAHLALFPRLQERATNMGTQLSGGEQQMLAIGRALMTNPRLLIMDEATEGLAPLIREEIWQCLGALRKAGQTLLVIDKYVERLIALADRHTIIERGRVVWQGTSDSLRQNPEIWKSYVGV